MKDKLGKETEEKLTNYILVYPSFLNGLFEYFVYIFGKHKLHRFSTNNSNE